MDLYLRFRRLPCILGLDVCADTLVGYDMLRGISGGQMKRVTIGEMLAGAAKALFMDEISIGLDSSTTFQIVNALRQTIHILQGTAVISLLQPALETYDLFYEIILISDGQIVYQGPRENVLKFFGLMGFQCPDRKGVADFFARKRLGVEIELSFKFGVNKKEGTLKSLHRKRIFEDEEEQFCVHLQIDISEFQLTLMAFNASTLFLCTEMSCDDVADGGIYMGALFYSLLLHMLYL
ncbi:hypothetical protein IFM89_012270 [Coptis chinensis]|uniref:ABC transporter family G domain-containing protein n=1 Tax=Coptis chinensis TaxID=261450 RepID=A0A835HDN0_9MAGN|nr:hypothetical protein IFM89_012270 [Coptis chinensis]